jgi:hypothetical protein
MSDIFGAQFNVLVHGFNVWCTDRDDLLIHIFHIAAEMVFDAPLEMLLLPVYIIPNGDILVSRNS